MLRLIVSFAILAWVLPNTAFSQEKKLKVKFGKISDEEIAMQNYPAEPSAPAVILFDKGEFSHRLNSVESRFQFQFEKHIRIKIFKKEAYDRANVTIFHYSDEKITDLDAVCYNMENGKLVETPVRKEDVFLEKITPTLRLTKFTIPGVREGSIIEYHYVRTNVAMSIPEWTFQDLELPVIWSEYEASVPPIYDFTTTAQGEVPFTVKKVEERNTSANGIGYVSTEMRYVQENIPSLKSEPYVHCPEQYLSQIHFDLKMLYPASVEASGGAYKMQLVRGVGVPVQNNWEDVGKDILQAYDDMLSSNKQVESETAVRIAGKNTVAEQTAALYEYIGKNFQQASYSYIWHSQSLDDLMKNHKGSPIELNLLFINMLHRAGVAAYPVGISTQEHGHILPYRVSLLAFDRIITAVMNEDASMTLIDVSAWPTPLGWLPEEDLNDEGLVILSKTEANWAPLQNKTASRSAFLSDVAIAPDGKVSGTASFSETGYGAISTRVSLAKKDGATTVKEKFPDLFVEGEAKDVKFENVENWQESNVKGSFSFEANQLATVSGNKIYFNPSLGLGLKDNPFKNPDRKFDIELEAPITQVHSITIKIPPGYKVEEAPKSTKMTFGENALQFEYYTEMLPDAVKVNIRRIIKQPYVPVEHYADLQQFYGNIVSKLEEQVVLSKM